MDARQVLAIGGPGWSRRAGSRVGHGAGFPGQWRLQVHAEGSPATLPCRRPAHVLCRARTWMEAEELGRRPPLGSWPHGSPVLFLSFFGRSTSIHFVFADPNVFSVVDCTWCSRFILFFFSRSVLPTYHVTVLIWNILSSRSRSHVDLFVHGVFLIQMTWSFKLIVNFPSGFISPAWCWFSCAWCVLNQIPCFLNKV
jgi:hypothetical protein